ncbi:MAG: FtsX-like permease family protein [Candidatus Thorarchaeota archaeon]
MFLAARMMSRAPQVAATLIVFSISAGVLGGILFYMDSAGPNVLAEMTEEIPVDMHLTFSYSFYQQNETTIADIEQIVASQEWIEVTETVSKLEYYDWRQEDYRDAYNVFLGVNDTFYDTFPNALDLDVDPSTITDTTCVVEEAKMGRLGLTIGDNLTLFMETYNETGGNWYTLEYNYTIIGTFTTDLFMQYYYWENSVGTSLLMVTTREGLIQTSEEIDPGYYGGVQDEIWSTIDHDIVATADPVSTMQDIEHRIEQQALPYASVSEFALLGAVYEYITWGTSMRAVALAFSIPTLVMAVMLVYYNSNLLADERRRDVGTLKTRGASGWQAFRWILSIALTTGVLGSFGAIVTGAISALVSATVREFLSFRLDMLAEFSLFLTPEAVIAVFLFAFIVGLIVALPSAVRALLMTPTEAHSVIEREALYEVEKMSSPAIDIIALGISGYLLTPILFAMSYMTMNFYSAILFAAFVIPLLGIFTVALTRLLSRPTSTVKSKVLARIGRDSMHAGSRVISGNIRLFKKSEAMGVMFVAMVFAAGIFSSLSATTGTSHMKQILTFEVGADISIEVAPGLQNVTLDILENITAVEGVAHASGMIQTEAEVNYWTSEWGTRRNVTQAVTVYGVQPHEWLDSAFWLDYFTKDFLPQESIPQLADDNSTILSSFKPVDRYLTSNFQYTPVYGDLLTLILSGPDWENISDCTILDVMASTYDAYGGNTYLPGESSASNFLVMNIDYVQACLNTSRIGKVYVDLVDGANYTRVLRDLYEIAPSSFQTLESAQARIDSALESRAGQSIYGAYTLNVVFAFIYLTAGVLIVAMVRFGKLRRQFSVMRAMGAEPSTILVAVLIESLTGVVLAALIGGLVGLLLTSFVIQLPLTYMGSMTIRLWTRLPVILAVPTALLVTILGAAVLSSLAATYFVVARNLRRNIAMEIQYVE